MNEVQYLLKLHHFLVRIPIITFFASLVQTLLVVALVYYLKLSRELRQMYKVKRNGKNSYCFSGAQAEVADEHLKPSV